MSLILSRKLYDQIGRQVKSGFPLECCGLLIGKWGGTPGDVAVEDVRPLKNAWPHGNLERRYAVDPLEWIAVEKEFSGKETGIIGIYHSHPRASACPSDFDTERAWPDYFYLILSVPEKEPLSARCWKLDEKDAMMKEVELVAGEVAFPY